MSLKKGISPLIATVLLIAFTITIATILSLWLTSFTKKTSEEVEQEALRQLECSRGGISLSNLVYNSSTSLLSGKIENSRWIPLGDISLQIVYKNFSTQKINLCLAGNSVVSCGSSNLSIGPREIYFFNVSVSDNYEIIRINTNCSAYGVYDEVQASEVL